MKWQHVLILIVVFLVIGIILGSKSSEPQEETTYEWNDAQSVTNFLAKEGYKVLSVSYYSYSTKMANELGITNDTSCYPDRTGHSGDTCWSNYTLAYLKMNAFAGRTEQVMAGLISLYVFDDVSFYKIVINEEAKTCYYIIDGDIWRAWTSNPESKIVSDNVKAEIMSTEKCE